MKKYHSLLAMTALFMGGTDLVFMGGTALDGNRRKPNLPRPTTPINKQENILKMIKEYKLIISGNSRQGALKQIRTKQKINALLEANLLSLSDIYSKEYIVEPLEEIIDKGISDPDVAAHETNEHLEQ